MRFSCRRLLVGASAAFMISAQGVLASQNTEASVQNSIFSSPVRDWQDHSDALGRGIIIGDTAIRALQFWTSDGKMRLFSTSTSTSTSTSVPLTNDLTRRGYTEVVEKPVDRSWAPTRSEPK